MKSNTNCDTLIKRLINNRVFNSLLTKAFRRNVVDADIIMKLDRMENTFILTSEQMRIVNRIKRDIREGRVYLSAGVYHI